MSMTLERPVGLDPPPEKATPLLAQLLKPASNPFALVPRAAFEELVHEPKAGLGHTVIVSDPEGVRRVLIDNVANYPKHELSDRFFAAMFGEGLLGIRGETWRRHRRIMAPAFAPPSVAACAPAMAEAATAWGRRWAALPDGAEVDISEEMKALTLQVICETMFSSDAPELTALADKALGEAQEMLTFGILEVLPLIGAMRLEAKRKALHAHFAGMDQAIYRMIAAREANLADAPTDLLTRLIAAKDPEAGGAGLSATEVRDEVITIFEAGHETTAVAMTWTWYALAHHPEAEARLHAELHAVLGGRTPTPEDLPKLAWTRQVIEESMRLYPPAPAVGTRTAKAADDICGVKVPAGARVIVSPWIIHRHRKLWDEPERFDPGRFSPEQREGRPRFAYLPFGAGPRVCIGAQLAMTEATLLLAGLAQRFRPRLAPGQEVGIRAQVTLAPTKGVRMRLERRTAA